MRTHLVRLSLSLCVVLLVSGCETEVEEFPDQIPSIVQTLGVCYRAVLASDPDLLATVSTDLELYADLKHVLGSDSLAILTRRITNPIDSAHVTMNVAAVERGSHEVHGRYLLEVFMRREGEFFWIVAHRLTHSRP
jgi:hypothetical protein